jgi:uncharacterized SAM-dependent methyltransferase
MGYAMVKRIYSLEEERDILKSITELGEVPTKYDYFGIGSKRWINIAKSRLKEDTKAINILERILLTQKAGAIFDSLSLYGYKNFNLIDLGCGDGSPLYPIFQYLRYSKPRAVIRYNPIDISPDMLREASRNIKDGFGAYGEQNKFDLDKGNFADITSRISKQGFGNLFMFLGSTLGNMPDMHKVLVNIKESMGINDYFLVGVELVNPKEIGRMMRDYYNVHPVYDLLFTTLEHFRVKKATGEYRIGFNYERSQVEAYFTPDRDLRIEIAGKQAALRKGRSILLARSFKFTAPGLADLFSRAGFRIEIFSTSRENNYAIILVQPAL